MDFDDYNMQSSNMLLDSSRQKEMRLTFVRKTGNLKKQKRPISVTRSRETFECFKVIKRDESVKTVGMVHVLPK